METTSDGTDTSPSASHETSVIYDPPDFKPFKLHEWDWHICIYTSYYWPLFGSHHCIDVDKLVSDYAIEVGVCANNPELPPPPISPEISAELLDRILAYARTEKSNFKLKPQYNDKNILKEMCILNPRIMEVMQLTLGRVPEYYAVFFALRELALWYEGYPRSAADSDVPLESEHFWHLNDWPRCWLPYYTKLGGQT